MYHFFVRQRLRKVFARLNTGDFAFVRRQFHPRAEHWFAGTHALSGRRSTPGLIAQWYHRLASVFPGIHFDMEKVIVAGPPWNTEAAIEWTDEIYDRGGRALPNQGVFIIRLRWGRAIQFRVYCDTSQIEKNLSLLASQGVSAAVSAPIEG